jgi:RNA polymerase sigma-70 factor (sigma-E family)
MTDFDDWVRVRGAVLLRFAYLVTRDHHRAEEAVQDALVAAYPRWPRIVQAGDPEAYLRRSIVNADISRWRRFRRRETPTDEPPPQTAGDIGADVAAQDHAWTLCARLPVRQRAAVVLRYYEGCSDAEIAQILDCTAGTVRSQIHRALATLRRELSVPEEEVTRS